MRSFFVCRKGLQKPFRGRIFKKDIYYFLLHFLHFYTNAGKEGRPAVPVPDVQLAGVAFAWAPGWRRCPQLWPGPGQDLPLLRWARLGKWTNGHTRACRCPRSRACEAAAARWENARFAPSCAHAARVRACVRVGALCPPSPASFGCRVQVAGAGWEIDKMDTRRAGCSRSRVCSRVRLVGALPWLQFVKRPAWAAGGRWPALPGVLNTKTQAARKGAARDKESEQEPRAFPAWRWCVRWRCRWCRGWWRRWRPQSSAAPCAGRSTNENAPGRRSLLQSAAAGGARSEGVADPGEVFGFAPARCPAVFAISHSVLQCACRWRCVGCQLSLSAWTRLQFGSVQIRSVLRVCVGFKFSCQVVRNIKLAGSIFRGGVAL